MRNSLNNTVSPDFLVHWRNALDGGVENIFCDPAPFSGGDSSARLRTPVAHISTSTTHIEVSDIRWTGSMEVTVTPYRLGFCLLLSTSSSGYIECARASETGKPPKPGFVLFMLPGKEFSGRTSAVSLRTVTCSFDIAYAERIVGSLDHLSHAQLFDSLDVRSSLISFILLRLMHEALYPGALSDRVVESLGQAMLVECARFAARENSAADKPGRLTERHFGIIEEYLMGLSGKAPSVRHLAQACGFSERYFAKLFRAQTGYSLAHYIKSVQIAKAKAYLLETDLPLKEIGYRLGFSTPAGFSSAFRVATGMTPGQLRSTR